MTQLALQAAGVTFSVETREGSELITVSMEAMSKIVLAMNEQHELLHAVKDFLKKNDPMFRLVEAIDKECVRFNKDFPISPEMEEMHAEKRTEAVRTLVEKVQGALAETLGKAVAQKPSDPDPSKLN